MLGFFHLIWRVPEKLDVFTRGRFCMAHAAWHSRALTVQLRLFYLNVNIPEKESAGHVFDMEAAKKKKN